MELPITLKRECVYQNDYFQVMKESRSLQENELEDYYVLDLPPAVMTLAWSREGKLLVCREWRQPTKAWVLGLPGGRVDKEETFEQAARRELLEEAGVTGEDWIEVGKFYPFVGITGQLLYILSAKNCKQTQLPKPERGEFIELLWLSLEELRKRIRAGERLDGILAASIWLTGD